MHPRDIIKLTRPIRVECVAIIHAHVGPIRCCRYAVQQPLQLAAVSASCRSTILFMARSAMDSRRNNRGGSKGDHGTTPPVRGLPSTDPPQSGDARTALGSNQQTFSASRVTFGALSDYVNVNVNQYFFSVAKIAELLRSPQRRIVESQYKIRK